VTPDGRRAAFASDDKTLKVWDLESGAVLATFTCDAEVWSCAFINNRKLIAGDGLGRVHFLCLEESKRGEPRWYEAHGIGKRDLKVRRQSPGLRSRVCPER
jgi:WD40 repeat protein